jgi:hypothetical protein
VVTFSANFDNFRKKLRFSQKNNDPIFASISNKKRQFFLHFFCENISIINPRKKIDETFVYNIKHVQIVAFYKNRLKQGCQMVYFQNKPIWDIFGGPLNGKCSLYSLAIWNKYIMAIWYILLLLYIFPRFLVLCAKKNLATLVQSSEPEAM